CPLFCHSLQQGAYMRGSTFCCPGCNALMKSAAPVPAGKRVQCGKCGTVFVTPQDAIRTAPRPSQSVARPQARPTEQIIELPPAPSERAPAAKQSVPASDTEARRTSREGPRRKKQSNQGLVLGLVVGGAVLFVVAA